MTFSINLVMINLVSMPWLKRSGQRDIRVGIVDIRSIAPPNVMERGGVIVVRNLSRLQLTHCFIN